MFVDVLSIWLQSLLLVTLLSPSETAFPTHHHLSDPYYDPGRHSSGLCCGWSHTGNLLATTFPFYRKTAAGPAIGRVAPHELGVRRDFVIQRVGVVAPFVHVRAAAGQGLLPVRPAEVVAAFRVLAPRPGFSWQRLPST